MKPKILFVEDDGDIRRVIATALEAEEFLVHQFARGENALAEFKTVNPDLALIDLRLPGVSGIEVVRRLRPITSIPLVILTAYGDSHDVVAGLEVGADDFLSKPIATKELIARLRAILRRTTSQPNEPSEPEEITFGAITIYVLRREVLINRESVKLTNTEFSVLVELVRTSPSVVTRHALLERVWGYDYLGDSRLVDMQIYRLRQKLEGRGLKEKLLTVRGVGFKIVQ